MPQIQELLQHRDWLLADGATGTNYFDMGLQAGDAPELWNTDHVNRVADLHRRFISAGADVILTILLVVLVIVSNCTAHKIVSLN